MAKPSDYSPGGQVYDRTTGTWAGENQGNLGDDRSSPGRGTFVIHDANGPVGVHLAPARQVAAGAVETVPGGAGSGPGAAAVGAVVPGVGAAGTRGGGTGPGSSGAVTGPLQPKLKPTHTQLLLGGTGWNHDPDWSDTAEWEERYGEPGDWLGGIVTMGVDLGVNARRMWDAWDVQVKSAGPVYGGNAGAGLADWWEGANSPFGPDKPIWGFDSGGF